jgi:signal transduction histidine kinase/CheY-like chemotaxis protein
MIARLFSRLFGELKRRLTLRFGFFFAFSIVILILVSGYMIAISFIESEKSSWMQDLKLRIDVKEERLKHFVKSAELFAANGLITNAIIDVAGRASYLPREMEHIISTKDIDSAGIVDFSGKLLASTSEFNLAEVSDATRRYVIETGKSRVECNGATKHVWAIAPINYYNTPQGALIIGTNFSQLATDLKGHELRSEEGHIEVYCGDQVVYIHGVDKKVSGYIMQTSADHATYPLGAMIKLRLVGLVPYFHVINPALYIVFKLSLIGVFFVFVGGYFARKIENDLTDALDMAQGASKARSQFLANMSHEIRTPLNGTLGNLNLLLDEPLTPQQREIAKDAKVSGQVLLDLLNDILDFSKIDAGHMRLEVGAVNIRELCANVEKSYRAVINEKGLRSVVDIDSNVPELMSGDALRIRQILNNLFSNAIKFTSQGSIDLKVKYESEHILFAISDSGIGIAADKLAKLFSPFTQAEASTTRKFGGTGLGLSICRDLSKMMGGVVGVESESGKGSTFTLKVPYVVPQGSIDKIQTTSVLEAKDVETTSLRILVAEDNAVNATLMRKLLARYGHDVLFAKNGVEAVQAVVDNNIDIVFMDCQMPEMDGYEATRKIIGLLGSARPKIIALTANAFKEDRDKCFEAGMDDYLTKPITRESLENAIRLATSASRIA